LIRKQLNITSQYFTFKQSHTPHVHVESEADDYENKMFKESPITALIAENDQLHEDNEIQALELEKLTHSLRQSTRKSMINVTRFSSSRSIEINK
jgi:hypothetical protein